MYWYVYPFIAFAVAVPIVLMWIGGGLGALGAVLALAELIGLFVLLNALNTDV